jgi:hypothetical protein
LKRGHKRIRNYPMLARAPRGQLMPDSDRVEEG